MIDELNKILPYIYKGECILFIGAGLSKIAGCQDWNSVVTNMLTHKLFKSMTGTVSPPFNTFSNEVIIDYCKNELTRKGFDRDFWGFIRKALIINHIKYNDDYKPIMEKLTKIKPLPIIFTTNIDKCIEDSGYFNLNNIFYNVPDLIPTNLIDESIFHIHGYEENIVDCVFTKTMYNVRYLDKSFSDFLNHVVSNKTFLFLGYSLRDNDLTNKFFMSKSREHFILFPTDDKITEIEKSVYLDQFNINVIEYGNRVDFGKIFKDWVDKNF